MPDPVSATGAVRGQTRYGALGMGARQFTGLWTQRSPYRDAAVEYLTSKFYSGSRFDSIIDGLNREITSRLTDGRRPGSAVFNANTFPAINSFYDWKYIQNNAEVIRVLCDGQDGTLYDATAGGKSALFTKSAGASATRFLSVNTSLFLCDGIDTKKILEGPATWQANANVLPGNLLNQGAEPGVMYMALGGMSLPIVATSVAATGATWTHTIYISPSQVPLNFPNLVGAKVTFSDLTTDVTLNGQTLTVTAIPSSTLGMLQVVTSAGAAQAYTADTGNGSTGNGTTGATLPAFNATRLAVTQDAGQQWKSYGPAVQNMGLAAPTATPTVTPIAPTRFWQPSTTFPLYTSLLDSNNNVEVVAATKGAGRSGTAYPAWALPTAAAQTVATNVAGVPVAQAYNFGAIEQNTSVNMAEYTGWGLVAAGGGIAFFELMVGATNPPSINKWGTTFTGTDKAGTGSNGKLGFSFTVPPGYYWQLNAYGDVQGAAGGLNVTPVQPMTTGVSTPAGANAVTTDGNLTWYNLGQPGVWQADAANAGVTGGCLLDSNGNLQWLYDGVGGTSGLTEPVWGTALGAQVTDGGLTWVCISTGDSGSAITTATVQYSFSTHAIDGSVSTASAPTIIYGGILGPSAPLTSLLTLAADVALTDPQIDQIWIWRTPQGEATPILEDQIPVDGLATGFSYTELGIPDVSATGGAELNALIAAPVADANDPPQSNMTALTYFQQRVWGIVDNTVVYSGGPDTVTGNGNTAFPPENEIPYPSQPIRLIPVTVQNGGMIVLTTDGAWIILGTGTESNPFYTTPYYSSVSVSSYNAIDMYNNAIFMMESCGKVSTLAVEYPFNPQTGYTEIGFPIGDQFTKTTTGGFNAAIFNPAQTYLTWNIQSSGETGMYVANGQGQWFRMGIVNPPESGLVWSPLASIQGGTSAVQSVETTAGMFQLLMGPAPGTTGPILARDATGTVRTDNGNAYPSWDAKGVIMLCSTGQWAEVAHVSAKSAAVGARPTVSVLFGEISPSAQRPYDVLALADKSNDPPIVRRSMSAYSDRYVLAQNGTNDTGDCIIVKFDYGTQAVADELLSWEMLASVHDEREEAAAR